MAMNPYIDMPLPVNVKVDFDLFARNGETKGATYNYEVESGWEHRALREVFRALNALAYAEGS